MKTINQMATDHDVSFRTLRFYEEKNLLHPTRAGTRRLYDEREEQKLRIIRVAKRLGFSLDEIVEIIQTDGRRAHLRGERVNFGALASAQFIEDRRSDLTQKREQVCKAISELQAPERSPA